jgi:hypothetical protein
MFLLLCGECRIIKFYRSALELNLDMLSLILPLEWLTVEKETWDKIAELGSTLQRELQN